MLCYVIHWSLLQEVTGTIHKEIANGNPKPNDDLSDQTRAAELRTKWRVSEMFSFILQEETTILIKLILCYKKAQLMSLNVGCVSSGTSVKKLRTWLLCYILNNNTFRRYHTIEPLFNLKYTNFKKF